MKSHICPLLYMLLFFFFNFFFFFFLGEDVLVTTIGIQTVRETNMRYNKTQASACE